MSLYESLSRSVGRSLSDVGTTETATKETTDNDDEALAVMLHDVSAATFTKEARETVDEDRALSDVLGPTASR